MNNYNNATLEREVSGGPNGAPDQNQVESVKAHLNRLTDELMASLPPTEQLSAAERRGIIARYSSVLEGNFVYWMTGAYLSAKSEEARTIILSNLREEVADCHPGMMRKFALAAHASPTETDAAVVYANLTHVRLFIGQLTPVPIVTMMAFFEGFIQRFMPYLADLANKQGSQEQQYTDVHGICDITHSQELYRALEAELALSPDAPQSAEHFFEGVQHLQTLIHDIVSPHAAS
jgi:hypothetical protein